MRIKTLFSIAIVQYFMVMWAQEPSVRYTPSSNPEPASTQTWIILIAMVLIGCGLFLCKVWFDAYRLHGSGSFTRALSDKKMILQKYSLLAGGVLLVFSYIATQSGHVNAGNLLGGFALLIVAAGSVIAEFM